MLSKFTHLTSKLLLASAALAVPSSWTGAPLACHHENCRSQPVNYVTSFSGDAFNSEEDTNWAGATLFKDGDLTDVRIITMVHDHV